MKLYEKYLLLLIGALIVTYAAIYIGLQHPITVEQYTIGGSKIKLPEPRLKSEVSIEEALSNRTSVRDYKNEPLALEELSQLLWSAQGVTRSWGGRTAPSAGATYPLEIYIVVGDVQGLPHGLYHYLPLEHSIERLYDGDIRANLTACALSQRWVGDGALDLVFAMEYSRTTNVYGKRGERYVHMEAGHAAQNVYLQCVSLGCGTVAVGAFEDECLKELLKIPEGQEPLYIMPVGRI